MVASCIHSERDQENSHVLLVTINHPPANAITLQTYKDLCDLFGGLEQDKTVRCVIITGAGDKFFSAGSDVKELGDLNPNSARERSRYARRAFENIRNAPVPVIAAVNGFALGSGLVIAMVCDVVIACEQAKFGLPEINAGVMGGTKHLARVVPEKTMRLMALTGRMLSAQDLQRLGVIYQVTERNDLLQAALTLASEITEKSPAGVSLMKEVINLTESMNLPDGYHVETYATAIITAHPNSKEAAQAFKEKRKPKFEN